MRPQIKELQKLQQEKQNYIVQQAEEIIDYMVKNKRLTYTQSTCDFSGWDSKLHHLFPEIAKHLRDQGLTVNSCVRHGVTEWTISI